MVAMAVVAAAVAVVGTAAPAEPAAAVPGVAPAQTTAASATAGFPFGGNPPPNGTFGIDHFLCYLTTAGPGSPPRAVSISDQFLRVPAFRTQTTTPDRLCTPVSVNDGKGFLAFKTGKNGPHLYCYRVTSRAQDKTVHTADQFGYDTLRMLRAERLCVASAKNRRKLTPAPSPPANFANYLCYAVRAVDSPVRRFPVINVNDQFWTTRTGVVVLRPAAARPRGRRAPV